MRSYNYFLSFLLLVCSISCSSNEGKPKTVDASDINAEFRQALKNSAGSDTAKNIIAYLVIPNVGCSGCISDAEMLLKNTLNIDNRVKFVLTSIESVKLLKVKIGVDPVNQQQIIMDKQNYFSKGQLRSIYPKVYFINKTSGDVDKVVEVSPFENGLDDLKKVLHK